MTLQQGQSFISNIAVLHHSGALMMDRVMESSRRKGGLTFIGQVGYPTLSGNFSEKKLSLI